MGGIDDYFTPQHEVDQCLASSITTVFNHFVDNKDSLEQSVDQISLSDVGDIISPADHIEHDLSYLPHSENPEDDLNQRLLHDKPMYARETTNSDLERLREIVESEDCSLPIVSLHPSYFDWQNMNNDDAPYRHAVIVVSIDEDTVEIRDPIKTMFQDANLNEQIPITQFKEVWGQIIDDTLNTSTPKQVMWFEERETDPGQMRL